MLMPAGVSDAVTPSHFLGLCLSLGIGIGAILCSQQPAVGADRIDLRYGPLSFPLPMADLEAYVEEGRITPAFAAIARHMDDATLSRLRQMLQRRYQMDQAAVYRMTQTQLVDDLIKRVGEMMNTPSGLNGYYAIRAALVSAAAEPGDWSILDVLRHFPTDIRMNIDRAQPMLNSARPNTARLSGVPNEAFNLLY